MSLLTPLLWLACAAPLLLFAQLTSKKTNFKYLFIFITYFLVDAYLQAFGSKYIDLDWLGLNWNWGGKILSLLLGLGFIFFQSKEDRQRIGFTRIFDRKNLRLGIIIFLGFLLFDFVFKMILFPKGGEFDLENFLFQASLPGLTEELLFRGIYLWLLGKAFISGKTVKGISFGWNFVIVTLLFGMMHGLALTEDLAFKYDLATIIYLSLISSLSLGILRKFSGNLILPIVGHNLINVMNVIIRIL